MFPVSWKTSLFGLIIILLVIGNVSWQVAHNLTVDWINTGLGVSVGLGLLCAKDHDVTGGTRSAEK